MSAARLPPPRRVVIENSPTGLEGRQEPAVQVDVDTLTPVSLFGGLFEKTTVGTEESVPAHLNRRHVADESAAPGSGIVLPGGANIYYLDLPPSVTTPAHRTPSVDYVVVLAGTPTLVTPKEAFDVVEGKATYTSVDETLLHPGEIVVQRGAVHSWVNKTDEWVRMLGVVLDAKAQELEFGNGKKTDPLGEKWLA